MPTIDALGLAAALTGAEEIPLWQAGATKKATIATVFGASATGLSGNGTAQGSATVLAAPFNVASTVTTPNNAFILPVVPWPWPDLYFRNSGAAAAQIFPTSGATINEGVTNAALTVNPSTTVHFKAASSTNFYTVP